MSGELAGDLAFARMAGPAGALRIAWLDPPAGAVGSEAGPTDLLILQGRAELTEKHAPLMREIAAWGYRPVTFEWRGQGGSARLLPDPRKGHIARFEDYLADLEAVLGWLRQEGRGTPAFVLGHSMGGHLALRAMAGGLLCPRGAVLTVPMLGIALAGWPPLVPRALARAGVLLGRGHCYAPGQKRAEGDGMPFEGNPLTFDQARFEGWKAALRAHPENTIGGVTYGWVDAALASCAYVQKPALLARVETPCLIMIASDEHLVDNRATREAVRHLKRARLLEMAPARHDLFLEADPVRGRVTEAIRTFLEGAA